MGVGLLAVALLITLMQGAWCKSWGVTLPGRIVGVSGSCLTVPCRFEVPDNEEGNVSNCSDGGVWNKRELHGPVVFTARNPQAGKIKGKMDGDLTKKNCTTTFQSVSNADSDMYFFRLDCSESLKFSFSKGVNISIRLDPSPPLMTSMTPVSEGTRVRLQCSVPVPCFSLPPSISWQLPDRSRQEQTQIQQSSDRLMTLTSTLTFNASSNHHSQNVSCSVTYPLTGGGSTEPSVTTQRLNVQYAPKITVATVSSSGPVSEGRIVTLNCSSDANPPVSNFTWIRIDSGKLVKTGEGDVLFLKVKQRDGGVYVCEARTPLGSQRSGPVTLEVVGPAGETLEPLSLVSVLSERAAGPDESPAKCNSLLHDSPADEPLEPLSQVGGLLLPHGPLWALTLHILVFLELLVFLLPDVALTWFCYIYHLGPALCDRPRPQLVVFFCAAVISHR